MKVDVSGEKEFQNGWTREQEQLMAEWSDIAACYRWLHDRTEKMFSMKNTLITIPVIILSTLTGTANFALGSFISDEGAKNYAQAGIGAVSIFAGILTTLGNYFKYAQNSEANRVASIAWGKFQRLLAVELAINPDNRIKAMDFLNICRNDLDRLIEQSPPIPDVIIVAFEKEFADMPNLKRPDIAHGLEHTRIFDSTKGRLNKVTADAALFLKARKKLLREDVLPDLDAIVERQVQRAIAIRAEKNSILTSKGTPIEGDWRQLLTVERGRSTEPKAVSANPLKSQVPGSGASVGRGRKRNEEIKTVVIDEFTS
jgi:hypothetical protein